MGRKKKNPNKRPRDDRDDSPSRAEEAKRRRLLSGAAEGPRQPKRKVAMIFGYVGTGYYGLQYNKGVRTIEEDLHRAICAAGGISPENADRLQKVKWMRTGRTDRDVHAAGQLISLKLIGEPTGIMERINEQLPPQIRVFGIQRTTNGFHAKNNCSGRRYMYYLPSYALDRSTFKVFEPFDVPKTTSRPPAQLPFNPPSHLDAAQPAAAAATATVEASGGAAVAEVAASGAAMEVESASAHIQSEPASAHIKAEEAATAVATAEVAGEAPAMFAAVVERDGHVSVADVVAEVPTGTGEAGAAPKHELPQRVMDYRVTPDILEELRTALAAYKGSHLFHNFTPGMEPSNPSAQRYMMSFEAADPVVMRGLEVIPLTVHGQSFMLHQIRKMIGLVVLLMRRGTPNAADVVREAFEPVRRKVHMVPGNGLLLDAGLFDAFNQVKGSIHGPVAVDAFKDKVDEFKHSQIIPHIIDNELTGFHMYNFIAVTDRYPTIMDHLPAPGTAGAEEEEGEEAGGGDDASEADKSDGEGDE